MQVFLGKIAAWILPAFQVMPPIDPSVLSRDPKEVGVHDLICFKLADMIYAFH